MKVWRKVLILLMLMVFIAGLGILLYPYLQGAITDYRIVQEAHEFLEMVETRPTQPEETTPPTQKEYSTLAQAYIDYTGMSGDAQMKFYYSFASGEAFTEWYKSAKAAYDAETEEIYIGADGQVNAGKD